MAEEKDIHDYVSERIARGLGEPVGRTAPESLEYGGGGGDDGGMQGLIQRVERLDKDVSDIKVMLARIEGRLAALPSAESIGEIRGKLSQVPNWWQMFIFVFTASGLAAGLTKLLSQHP